MPRQPRYAKRYVALATDAVLAGKTAHKALALALGITPTTLTTWLAQQPDLASALADARADLKRRKAEAPAQAGRKSLYDASTTDNAARLHAAAGKDDKAIAKALGVFRRNSGRGAVDQSCHGALRLCTLLRFQGRAQRLGKPRQAGNCMDF